MQVTQYPQSCLVVAGDGRGPLIDPGVVVTAKCTPDDITEVDALAAGEATEV
jgi:hypothetical protein